MTKDFSGLIASLRSALEALDRSKDHPEEFNEALLHASVSFASLLDQAKRDALEEEKGLDELSQDLSDALDELRHDLKASESRYRAIVENQTELICRFTPQGELTFYNEAFCDYFAKAGTTPPDDNIRCYFPDNKHVNLSELLTSLSHEEPVKEFEVSHQKIDNLTVWLQWTFRGNFDDQGKLAEIQAVGHDITDRKQVELATHQHNRELSALHTATAALLTTLDPEALLGRILDAAISAIPAAEKGMIHLIAQDTGQLEMRASIGYHDPRIRRIKVTGEVSYITKAVKKRKPVLIRDMQSDPAFDSDHIVTAHRVRSAIVAPLILGNQIFGALSLESPTEEAFSENDLSLLVSFAATATAAINNARLHQEVQKQAITDALTGLYNRRGLYELGQREVERARRFKRPLVAIMFDIDEFKRVNDNYGHASGDQVLLTVAKRCRENLRRIDILGRFGGDEFIILLPETDMFTASRVAERLRQKICSVPVKTQSSKIQISISMGVSKATPATPDLDILVSRADGAMYLAKKNGGNRIEFM